VIELLSADAVLVATNRHVVVHDLSELPPGIVAPGSKLELEAVFRSGLGPEQEQALHADIRAADLSDNRNTDLAFLELKGLKNPPAPIDPMVRIGLGRMTISGRASPGRHVSRVTESKGTSVAITGGRIARRAADVTVGSGPQVDGRSQPVTAAARADEKTSNLLRWPWPSRSVDTRGFVAWLKESTGTRRPIRLLRPDAR
jgi:hypothetical protein